MTDKKKSDLDVLLVRCPSSISIRLRTGVCDDYHNSLGRFLKHPDCDVVRLGFNAEHEVYYKGSSIHMLDQGLNTAWGPTIQAAAATAIKMLDYPSIYTRCPECRCTQTDLDFEVIPRTRVQKCRICGAQKRSSMKTGPVEAAFLQMNKRCRKCHLPGHERRHCPNGEASRLCAKCFGRCNYKQNVCHHCLYVRRTTHNYPKIRRCSYCGETGHNIRSCEEGKRNPARIADDYDGEER